MHRELLRSLAEKTVIDSKHHSPNHSFPETISKKEKQLLYNTLKTITQFMSIIIEITPSNYTKAEIEMTREINKISAVNKH